LQIVQQLENESYKSSRTYIPDEDEISALSSFSVKLDNYEGHFEELLSMVEKRSMEVLEVCLAKVTGQYLEYLACLPKMDVSIASEFLLIAAYLIERKSKGLLPVEEESHEVEEIESCLVDHLALYKVFKDRSAVLKERKELFSRIYHRFRTEEKCPQQVSVFLSDVAISDLTAAFRKIWLSAKSAGSGGEIVDEIVTVEERINQILDKLALSPSYLAFEDLFEKRSRLEIIVTFLAVLELMRQKAVQIKQDIRFGCIQIFPKAGMQEVS